MDYVSKNGEVLITIPANNSGKYRFKTRKNNLDFGESFATRTNPLNEEVYLEWQIGYDATVSDINREKKDTSLRDYTFHGANGKEKYLYELSELFSQVISNKLLSIEDLRLLLEEIQGYKDFIDDKKILTESNAKILKNDLEFDELTIKLPTFFLIDKSDNTQIEVSIQKQQYASGVQPMVYFCIPILSFKNYDQIIGRPSVLGDELIYVINKDNVKVLINLVKVFAMCSKRHNFDIQEILKILIKMIDSTDENEQGNTFIKGREN